MKFSLIVLPILASLGLGACSSQPLQPWDRDILAQRKMNIDPYPLDSFIDEHIYFSKEASRGGAGLGGGGCGCN